MALLNLGFSETQLCFMTQMYLIKFGFLFLSQFLIQTVYFCVPFCQALFKPVYLFAVVLILDGDYICLIMAVLNFSFTPPLEQFYQTLQSAEGSNNRQYARCVHLDL